MRIGILTYHSSHNYGAFLQAYALSHVIEDETGNQTELIDFTMKKAAKVNRDNRWFNKRHVKSVIYNFNRYKMFETSRKVYQKLSCDSLISDDLEEFANWLNGKKYDVIVVGSDEIWKLDGYRGFPNPYWLPGITNCKKMAYAASSRTELEKITPENKQKIGQLLQSFSYIGVRDAVTEKLIEDVSDRNQACHLNCDPTMAYDFKTTKQESREFVAARFGNKGKKKKIALMIGVPELAYNIIKRFGNEYDFISLYDYYGSTKGFIPLDPFEWMKTISGVDGLITTFYHGMIFAIKNDTPFLMIENREMKEKEYSKSYDLLNRYSECGRRFAFVTDENIMDRVHELLMESEKGDVDFSSIREAEKRRFQSFIMALNE